MTYKERFTRNIVVNLIIITMLVVVGFMGFQSEVAQVFSVNKLSAIYKGNTEYKRISLMINVYWGTEYLDEMLDVLQQYNVKVTFFVGGMWACENEVLLTRMTEDGHEIGNHGYYHKDHDKISQERNEEEIYITHNLIKSLVGVEMSLFAPPSGAYNNVTLEVAERLGYRTIMWSKDTIDWRDKDTQLIYNRATSKPSNGDLILMHPTKNTLEALPDIINFYLNNEYLLVTVSENLT